MIFMKFCPNCGKEVKEYAKFCAACGYTLADYQAPGQAVGAATFEEYAKQQKESENVFESAGSQKSSAFEKNTFDDIGVKEPKYSDYANTERTHTADSETYPHPDPGGYETSTGNGYAVASLILGLIGIPFNLLLFIPGILAIVFGVAGLNRSKETGTGHGMAMTGLILGIVVSAGYFILILSAVLFATVSQSL